MAATPQGPTRREKLTLLLSAVNLARDVSGTIPPARAAFASVGALLTMIRVYCLLFVIVNLWLTFI